MEFFPDAFRGSWSFIFLSEHSLKGFLAKPGNSPLSSLEQEAANFLSPSVLSVTWEVHLFILGAFQGPAITVCVEATADPALPRQPCSCQEGITCHTACPRAVIPAGVRPFLPPHISLQTPPLRKHKARSKHSASASPASWCCRCWLFWALDSRIVFVHLEYLQLPLPEPTVWDLTSSIPVYPVLCHLPGRSDSWSRPWVVPEGTWTSIAGKFGFHSQPPHY